jgi:hypothetical protein
MKFKDLIDKYAWDDAQAALLRLYPDEEKSIEGYQQVYEALRSLSPAETKMRICIESVTSDLDGETYVDVSGKDGRTRREASPEVDWDDEQGNKEESFGIEFSDWAEWLGMEIDAETAPRYSELEIIGHCLWEMTFFGYTQEKIKGVMDDIQEHARNVEGRSFKSVEELFAELDRIDEDPTLPPTEAGVVP